MESLRPARPSLAQALLVKEYERMCVEIRSVESNSEKAIAFGLSIITAAFAVGVAQHVHQIFFVVPFAIVGVFFYAIMMYTHVFSMGGYKRFLEDQLNELAGQHLIMWERMVEVRQQDNMIRPALVAIYLIIGLVLGGLSAADIATTSGTEIVVLVAVLIIALLVVLIFAVRRMLGIYERIYEAARKQSEIPVVKTSGEGDTKEKNQGLTLVSTAE